MYMDSNKLNEETIKVVYSDEAKKVFEDGLKDLDQKALTSEGIIKTYEIDKESVKRNPMGGINGVLVINNDKDLYVRFHLDKENNGEFKRSVISGNSSKLGEMLRGEVADG